MVQSLNVDALRATLTRVVLASSRERRRLLTPRLVTLSVRGVDWDRVRRELPGVQRVVFDADNTLVAPYCDDFFDGEVLASMSRCQETFGQGSVAVLSNSAGVPSDDPGLRRKLALERNTGLPVVVHTEKKPLCLWQVLDHFADSPHGGSAAASAREEPRGRGRDVLPASILVVGDRLLTDTLFGNLSGMPTMHCTEPLQLKGDNNMARVLRVAENWVLRRFLFAGVPGLPAPAHAPLLPSKESRLL